MSRTWFSDRTPVGIGLRHVHYHDALAAPADIDFFEVHSENFFARGGATLGVLEEVAGRYPVSLHGTSLGLGSVAGISPRHLDSLVQLADRISPALISDHAAFGQGVVGEQLVHAGDLLPIAFNESMLQVMTENVLQVQERLGRQILVENLSAYLEPPGSTLTETEFLTELAERSGCRLLVDINNLAVNAVNTGIENVAVSIKQWLDQIPATHVGEIHLAGCTPAQPGGLVIDDHSQKVSDTVWDGYHHAITRFGQVPTLIEWDTQLPEWQVLLNEANKARRIAEKACNALSENSFQEQPV
ncbi:MbnB/TglH/ChrH family RiPP precursor modification enzyme [Spongorhabdus nitratireducens]